jgi:hypothetical protein
MENFDVVELAIWNKGSFFPMSRNISRWWIEGARLRGYTENKGDAVHVTPKGVNWYHEQLK